MWVSVLSTVCGTLGTFLPSSLGGRFSGFPSHLGLLKQNVSHGNIHAARVSDLKTTLESIRAEPALELLRSGLLSLVGCPFGCAVLS